MEYLKNTFNKCQDLWDVVNTREIFHNVSTIKWNSGNQPFKSAK